MIFYTVTSEYAMEGEEAFATKAEAIAAARDEGSGATVSRVETGSLSGRELAVALFNRQGYAAVTEVVFTAPDGVE